MFKGTSLNSLSSNFDITNFIDGYDIFNSEFINRIDQIENRESLLVANYGKLDESGSFTFSRPDLISSEIYPNSQDYLSLLLVASRLNSNNIVLGDTIDIIPSNSLPNIVLED